MTKEKLKTYSNIIFWLTTAFAVFTLVVVGKDYIAMAGTGVCPIAQNNGLVYTALALLLGSIVITSILDAKVKKMEKTEKEETSIYDKTLETLKQEYDDSENTEETSTDKELVPEKANEQANAEEKN